MIFFFDYYVINSVRSVCVNLIMIILKGKFIEMSWLDKNKFKF